MINCQKASVHSARKILTHQHWWCAVSVDILTTHLMSCSFFSRCCCCCSRERIRFSRAKFPHLEISSTLKFVDNRNAMNFMDFYPFQHIFSSKLRFANCKCEAGSSQSTHTHTEPFSLAFQWPPPPVSEWIHNGSSNEFFNLILINTAIFSWRFN